MSKAFTKEEQDGPGVATPELHARALRSPVTALGARAARERAGILSARLARAVDAGERAHLELERDRMTALAGRTVARAEAGGRVAFGAEVLVRDARGGERTVVLASADEVGLVPGAMSLTSPLARALLGAAKGDRIEWEGPAGTEELSIVHVRFPA